MSRFERVRWWLHSQRPKHERRMAFAESRVEASEAYKRVAAREGKSLYARLGIEALLKAIDVVVKCGCPSWLWRESVREHIKDST